MDSLLLQIILDCQNFTMEIGNEVETICKELQEKIKVRIQENTCLLQDTLIKEVENAFSSIISKIKSEDDYANCVIMVDPNKFFDNSIQDNSLQDCNDPIKDDAVVKKDITIKKENLESKQFQCEFCQLLYTNMGNLKQHIRRIHLKIKTAECIDCGIKFYNKATLNKHENEFHLKRVYKCVLCNWSCKRKYYLNQHIKQKHSDEKDVHLKQKHQCSLCEFVSKREHALNNHIKQKHNNEKAESCEYPTDQKSEILKHMKEAKPEASIQTENYRFPSTHPLVDDNIRN